jgi:hypothetical protein
MAWFKETEKNREFNTFWLLFYDCSPGPKETQVPEGGRGEEFRENVPSLNLHTIMIRLSHRKIAAPFNFNCVQGKYEGNSKDGWWTVFRLT